MIITDRDRRIITMWIAGFDYEAIAAELKISRGVLVRRAHLLGIPHRLPGPGRRVDMWPYILHWLGGGHEPGAIADALGLTGRARLIAIGWELSR